MRQFIVLSGAYDKKTNVGDYEVCIGIYKTAIEAYGKAYLNLSGRIIDSMDNKAMITAPYKLEADAGYGMHIVEDMYSFVEYVHILFYEEEDDG